VDRPALPKEDLFEASTMTFGEHLEELRKSLARALVWWAAGALVALLFAAKPAVRYIQGPLEKAIIEYKAERGIERYRSDENVDPEADPERLEQLRQMMIDQGVSWEKVWIVPRQGNIGFEGNTLAPQDTAPQGKDTQDTAPQGKDTQGKADASATASSAVDGGKLPAATDFVPVWILRPTEATLNAHKIEEPFMIYLKAAVVIGSLIASPMIFYHLWGFVAAGLYPHERRYVYIYLPFSVSLFTEAVFGRDRRRRTRRRQNDPRRGDTVKADCRPAKMRQQVAGFGGESSGGGVDIDQHPNLF